MHSNDPPKDNVKINQKLRKVTPLTNESHINNEKNLSLLESLPVNEESNELLKSTTKNHNSTIIISDDSDSGISSTHPLKKKRKKNTRAKTAIPINVIDSSSPDVPKVSNLSQIDETEQTFSLNKYELEPNEPNVLLTIYPSIEFCTSCCQYSLILVGYYSL